MPIYRASPLLKCERPIDTLPLYVCFLHDEYINTIPRSFDLLQIDLAVLSPRLSDIDQREHLYLSSIYLPLSIQIWPRLQQSAMYVAFDPNGVNG
jgi:hypothetical protein